MLPSSGRWLELDSRGGAEKGGVEASPVHFLLKVRVSLHLLLQPRVHRTLLLRHLLHFLLLHLHLHTIAVRVRAGVGWGEERKDRRIKRRDERKDV